MNLINRSDRKLHEPYQSGVYILTGVNGIGKSTIVDAITADHPETVPLRASQELSKLFNGISREEMELLTPEEKLGRMVMHFIAVFEHVLDSNKAVILDTHLLVPIRKDDDVIYEDIWSSEYTPYTKSMAMLAANPSSVRKWRLKDERATGRKRNTSVEDIASDQDANLARFNELQATGDLPIGSDVVNNTDGRLKDARRAIEDVFTQSI